MLPIFLSRACWESADSPAYTGENFWVCSFNEDMPVKRREFLKSATAASVTAAWAQPPLASAALPQNNSEPPFHEYPLGPDSKRQPNVPIGKVFSFSMDASRFFPGKHRTIQVYVPAQYTTDRPACVLVALDQISHTLPIVLDNLIHGKAMPATIAIADNILKPGFYLRMWKGQKAT